MLHLTHGYGLLGVCGGVALSLLLPSLEHHLLWWWIVLVVSSFGFTAGLIILLLPVSSKAWRSLASVPRAYFIQWPVGKRKGWPYTTDLAGWLYHAKTIANFDNLEADRGFRVTLFIFNASPHNLEISSVSGVTQFDALAGTRAPDIAWTSSRHNKVSPLNEFTVEFEQRMLPEAMARIKTNFDEGKVVSIMLAEVQISARAVETNEVAQIRLWDGIGCSIPTVPVVTGRIVSITASISTDWSGNRNTP